MDLAVVKTNDFYLRASGTDIEEVVSGHIQVVPREGTRMVSLNVKSSETARAAVEICRHFCRAGPGSQGCSRRLSQWLTEWEKKNYQPAADYFEKATVLYPQYDEAFNYLGMMYAHLDQPEKSRAAFETAVKLNDKNASADRNLPGSDDARPQLRTRRRSRAQVAGDRARELVRVDDRRDR